MFVFSLHFCGRFLVPSVLIESTIKQLLLQSCRITEGQRNYLQIGPFLKSESFGMTSVKVLLRLRHNQTCMMLVAGTQ